MPLKTAEEWAAFYNTEGGDEALVLVCCQSVQRSICDSTATLNFMVVGDRTTLEAGYTKKIVYRCAANNNVVKHAESGACEGPSNSGGGGNSDGPDHPGGDRNGDGRQDGADNHGPDGANSW